MPVSLILSPPSRLAALRRGNDHSSRPAITDGIQRPTRTRRTGRPLPNRRIERRTGCVPIWSCSVRGFACHPCCHGRGALLPHLFTLTRQREARRRAVCFLCHCP